MGLIKGAHGILLRSMFRGKEVEEKGEGGPGQ